MPTSAPLAIVNIDSDYLRAYIGTDDTRAQMSDALFKVMDNVPSLGGLLPYYSFDRVTQYRDMYKAQGIGMIPWVVVRGFDTDSAHAEGVMAGQYAAAVDGRVLVDLEDDKAHYWQGIEACVDAWMEGFLAGGGREVYLWPDTRAGHLAGANFWRWWATAHVTEVWPQAYFAAFYKAGTPGRVRRGIDDSVQPLLQGGISPDKITPTLMTSDEAGNPIPWAELLEGIMYCKELRTNRFSIWRRQFLSQEQRDGLAALDDPFAPAVPPPQQPKVGRETRIEPITFDAGARVVVDWGDTDDERVVTITIPPISGKVRIVRDS